MTAKQAHREAVLRRDEGRCRLIDLIPGHVCSGRLTSAHVVSCQRLRQAQEAARIRSWRTGAENEPLLSASLDVLIADPDNGLTLCSDSHADLDHRRLRLPRELLPEHVEFFAERYGLQWSLDRDFEQTPQPEETQ